MSYDQSQCVLLALCVCALGRGLMEKVLGLGQQGGGVPPPYSPPNCRTPLGVTHWLAAAPVMCGLQEFHVEVYVHSPPDGQEEIRIHVQKSGACNTQLGHFEGSWVFNNGKV